MKLWISFVVFFLMPFMYSQSVLGKWKTIDDETGQAKSIVEIYEKSDGKVYAKIIKLLIKPKNNLCVECTDDRKYKPLIGLEIIRGLEKAGDEYTDGTITDPKNGKSYSCTISLENKDKLKVRGYLGFSFLGRTQYWHRIE